MRVKLLVATISLFVINHLQAQTVFWSEDFGTGCSQGNAANGTVTGNGTWNVTNVTAPASDANMWYVSATEAGMGVGNCGDGCLNNAALTNRTLHVGSVPSSPSAGFICPTGDCGAAYDSGGGCPGFGCVSVNDRAESPVINCTGQNTITLSFLYFEGTGDLANDFMEVMYSANGGGTWSSLAIPGPTNNSSCPLDPLGDPQGNWTTFTVALPASADNNPNVMIGFRWQNNDDAAGNDPAPAIDDIQLSVPAAATPTVTINPLPNDSICVSSTLTLQGSANPGPITAWAWTVNPTAGVVFNPDTAAQNPTVTFTTPGTYTFTLFATNAGGTGNTTQVITVLAPSVPTVTITASPSNPVCLGSAVGFTATPTNGGSAPSFTWSVNGVAQAGNTNTFSSSTLVNNDVITVTVTSSDTCVSPATANDSYTVQVVASVAPSVTIVASSPTACAGTPVSFTATPTNGGTTPAFQWQVNGINAGANSPNFSSSSLNNNDTVRVILTSNDACASPTTDTSNTIVISITPTVVPSVAVAASATSVCAGSPMSFTATPSNGGVTPAYQWQVNGVNAGANSPNFSSSTLNNGDTVAVILTSNDACPSPATASDTVFVVITPTVVPGVTIAATPTNPVCATTTIDFTATPTNGGLTPSYQWQVNGVNAGSNSPNFSSSPWANNDVVTVTMTSSDACPVPASASTAYTVGVVTPTVNATANSVTVCPGIGDTLTAAATAGSTFNWTPSAGLSVTNNDTTVATQAAPGTYTYYVTATFNGCSVTDSVQVTVNNFTVGVGPAQTICYGDSTLLFVTGGTSWTWIPSLGLHCDTCQTTMASPSTNPTTTTSTTYSAIVSNGVCTDTVTETVTVIPNASPAFTTTVLQQGLPQLIGFTNNSTNATSFFWTLGNGNTSVLQTPANQNYPVEGSYTVTLIAYGVNGCNDTTSTVIMVSDTIGITVPNIFTPNGDQINDVWKPSVHGATSLECVIFDRWGIQMYEFVNTQDKWDGHTTAGQVCTEGTYYYILKASTRDNKSYNLKGFIQLIR